MAYRVFKLSALPSLETLPADQLLTIEETAAYLGFSPSTLEHWRTGSRGRRSGPRFIPMHSGDRAPIRYMVKDVREWIDEQRVDPETDQRRGAQKPARSA